VNAPLDWTRDGADWPHAAASRFVRAGGTDWHVQVLGEGPALLLAHGTAASTHSFRRVMSALAGAFTLIAPDLPGHGFTAAFGDRPPTLPNVAAGLAALLGALGIRPEIAAGHSAGAAVLTRMALDAAIEPRAIVSFNGALRPYGGAASGLFSSLARLAFLNPLAPRLFAWRARDPGAVARLIRNTGSDLDAESIGYYARLLRAPGHVRGALSMMAHWDLDALQEALPELRIPLILAVGVADRAVPPADAERLAARMPTAEIVRLPGLGHLAHEEAPGEAAALIRRAARDHGVAGATS